MEKSIKPDKKYFTKIIWTLLTISVLVIIGILIIHAIINLSHGNPQAPGIIWLIGILALVLMWLITTPISYLWYKNLTYIVENDRVQIYKGIITKTQQNIPFRAITDFALQRSLYDRMLGTGSINIQTAGQSHNPSGYEGKLAGLIAYEELHSDLREKIKTLHPVSETLTTTERSPKSTADVFEQILQELREIRKNTAKKS